jgi:5-methylcytosine-specific restriction endonuclease McrA
MAAIGSYIDNLLREIEESITERVKVGTEDPVNPSIPLKRKSGGKRKVDPKKKAKEPKLQPKAKEPKLQPKPKVAKPKEKIPKKVKDDVWNTYIGEGIAKHKCLCCKLTTIDKAKFDCGHVVSEKNGGNQSIRNLRPICNGCNLSMAAENMIEYVKRHEYFIG